MPLTGRLHQFSQALAAVSSSVINSAAPAAIDARQLNYQPGKTYRYDWKVVVDTKSTGRDKEGTIAQTGQQKSVMSGVVDVTIQGKAADGTVSGQVTISSPFVCSTDGTTSSVLQGADYDKLVNDLMKPLLFKQTSAGKVTEVSVPQDSQLLAINMQKGIVNALQATLKEDNSYSAQEQGAQGTYLVSYTVTDKADGSHITKTYNQNSFSQLISSGAATDKLTQSNTVDMVLNTDGIFKSVKSAEEMQSSNENSDPPSTGNAGLDGVAAWSTTTSTGSLDLRSVMNVSKDVLAASLSSVYRIDDLGAELSEQLPNPKGIDLSKINLANEFALLEAEPTNPSHVLRIADLVFADDSEAQTVIAADPRAHPAE